MTSPAYAKRSGGEIDFAPSSRDPRAASARSHSIELWMPTLAIAIVCWALSVGDIRTAGQADYGLLQAASPLFAISIVLTVIGFVLAVRTRSWAGIIVATASLIAIERLTISIGTDAPFYPWTYKHIAVVSYIQRYGGVSRGLDIYNQWPGLFSATAWLSDLTGVSAMSIAHWFTPAVHVVEALAVYGVARAWRATPPVAAATVFIWEALSFIAQDYFSPQALAYLLGLAVLACFGLARTDRRFAYLSVLPFAGVTMTHQLSPYWLLLAAFLLMFTRQLRPWWIPIVLAAIALGYLYWNYAAIKHYGGAVSGSVGSNFKPSAKSNDVFPALFAFRMTEFVYAVVFGGSLLATLANRRARREWVAPAVLTFSPILLLAAQSYGGEAIFRVYLFALPGASLVLAPFLIRGIQGRVPVRGIALLLAALTVAAAAQSYFAGWFAYRVTADEVAATNFYVQDSSAAHSYLTSVAPGWPQVSSWQYANHTTQNPGFSKSIFADTARVGDDLASTKAYSAVMATIEARKKGPTYLVISERNQYYGWFVGALPKNSLDRIDKQLSQDSRWQLAFQKEDAKVYKLIG